MRKGILFAIAGVVFLAGCQNQAANTPATPKWKGPAYRLAFGAAPAKANPAGITLPAINFTANPDALERRVDLVVQIDTSGVKSEGQVANEMIMAPVNVSGAEGALPADYLEDASKDLANMLASYCLKGKIKIQVALASSTLMTPATNAQVEDKRVSDWLPMEIVFKNPHPKC